MNTRTVELFKGEDGQFYFRLIAVNGEPLATSEGHKNRADVLAVVLTYFVPSWSMAYDKSWEGGES
jgi:hypothetical protein